MSVGGVVALLDWPSIGRESEVECGRVITTKYNSEAAVHWTGMWTGSRVVGQTGVVSVDVEATDTLVKAIDGAQTRGWWDTPYRPTGRRGKMPG